ncbi:ABC transporter substrate-binding protein [Pseudomonas asiatica]|uniref:ABC transporter substrate-binding protein n=1 Tax=Pseudomonas asiatica TaxID=2219225 RepID=UPI00257116E4|nr:ABC transporter substrate-binding protein [Pseudomonas asiatica]WJD72303.1 ABC transporter substrate-binding protein [Pseudomonas asiatica]
MIDNFPSTKALRLLLSLAIAGSTVPCIAADAPTVTVAGYGGNLQDALIQTLWKPAAEQAGVSLRTESHDGQPSVRLQVQSGKPAWDAIHIGANDCAALSEQGLFEPLDYSVINADGIPSVARGKDWVATNSYSVVMGWRTDKFKEGPKNWQEFWDTKKFPGRRALSVAPDEMLEVALLADGVPRDKLYPLDIERGLASLENIKPSVAVWWTSGAQSSQLIKDGEVDLIAIWSSRVDSVVKDKAPVAYTYEDGLLGYGCMAILKGAKNVAVAQKLIASTVSADIQARIPTMMGYYGPTNDQVFTNGNFPAQVLEQSNMSPDNRAKQTMMDPSWWGKHLPEVQEDYKELIAK